MRRLMSGAMVAACAVATLAACQPRGASGGGIASGGIAGDTLRGLVTIVGNEPVTTVMIAVRGAVGDAGTGSGQQSNGALGGTSYALTGASLPLLRNVVGLEIMVEGRRTSERAAEGSPAGVPVFDVRRFVVRAANGVSAIDGTVISRGGAFSLRMADSSEVLMPALPASLKRVVGARVWVAGRVDAPAESYGVIALSR